MTSINPASMLELPLRLLIEWAMGKPTIESLYVFGSYARGQARPDSDLDLAFEFINADDGLSELITNAAAWKDELSRLTGLVVKDIYLSTDAAACGAKVLIFSRRCGETLIDVVVEPSLRGQEHIVIHADDDTDEDQQAKQRLLAAVLRHYADHLDTEDEIAAIVTRADADIAAGRTVTVTTAAESDALHDAAMARLRARLAAADPGA